MDILLTLATGFAAGFLFGAIVAWRLITRNTHAAIPERQAPPNAAGLPPILQQRPAPAIDPPPVTVSGEHDGAYWDGSVLVHVTKSGVDTRK